MNICKVETIELRDVLAWMESGRPFSLKAVKYDRSRKSGGDEMKFVNASFLSQHTSLGLLKLRTATGEVRHVYQRLIVEFNNKKVIW